MTNEQTGILLENIYKRLDKAIHEANVKVVTKVEDPFFELRHIMLEIKDQVTILMNPVKAKWISSIKE